jgi:type IV fimbrial biogenesis protein FimT
MPDLASLGMRTLPRRQGVRYRTEGFTLVELMIVLVIVGVLVAIAAPSYSTLILRTKLKSYANEVVASAYLARSEAIKRNAEVRLCVSADGRSCAGSGDWDQGWIVVVDPNDVIKRQQPLSTGIKLFELSSVAVHTITFKPSGVASDYARLKVCQQTPSEGIEEKVVTISVTGRPRVATKADGCP